jgi:hypothetical protein
MEFMLTTLMIIGEYSTLKHEKKLKTREKFEEIGKIRQSFINIVPEFLL